MKGWGLTPPLTGHRSIPDPAG